MTIYFVRADHAGFCVWGGHFEAADPTEARRKARDAFNRDQETARRHNMCVGPFMDDCTWFCRKSKASPANVIA